MWGQLMHTEADSEDVLGANCGINPGVRPLWIQNEGLQDEMWADLEKATRSSGGFESIEAQILRWVHGQLPLSLRHCISLPSLPLLPFPLPPLLPWFPC